MRTYELHAHFKQVKRSDGRSSVAAAAYRAGERLRDERTGEIKNFTRRTGIEATEIFTPANAPEWAADRSKLWNEVEQVENRSNSMVAQELEISFPSEFNQAQRQEAGQAIAQRLVDKYDVAADIAYHLPDKEGDQRNYHAHILFTSRAIGADGWAKKKYRDFNKDRIEVDGEKTTVGTQTVKEWRGWLANTFNQIAQRDGLQVHTEHESLEKRGIDRIPTVKMGQAASQLEKAGIETDRGNLNREIQTANQLSAQIIDLKKERKRRIDLVKSSPEKIVAQYENQRKTIVIRICNHYRTRAAKAGEKFIAAQKIITELYQQKPSPPKKGFFSILKQRAYKKDYTTWSKKNAAALQHQKEMQRLLIPETLTTFDSSINRWNATEADKMADQEMKDKYPQLVKDWEEAKEVISNKALAAKAKVRTRSPKRSIDRGR